jgi:hypothetical protein
VQAQQAAVPVIGLLITGCRGAECDGLRFHRIFGGSDEVRSDEEA